MRMMFASMLMVIAAPAYSATAVHVFACEQDDDATQASLDAAAINWLKAARTMKGGANLKATVYYPVAARMALENDLFFIVTAPSIAEWGEFWDGYAGSAAEKVDQENREIVICPSSALFESVEVK